ncbi:MAG TPA: Lrp/AsnC family transcriptional regulator [Beijerinckia sp.]|nr:Lrp/AsnC family transcriptional regulator [Beijerinckia sp.]
MEIDRFDQAILAALVGDARTSIVDLAPRVGLSSTACARRLKALEERGVIKGYHLAVDLKQLGYEMTALVRVTLDSQREEALEGFERAVAQCSSVVRCHLMSGSTDYLLIVLCRDMADFETIYRTELARLPRVARIESSFAMRDVVDRTIPKALFVPPVTPKPQPRARRS